MIRSLIVLAAALLSWPHGGRVDSEPANVDLIELNHFRNSESSQGYDQVITYEWSPDYRRYHVTGWYIVEPDDLRGYPQQTKSGFASAMITSPYRADFFEIRSKLFRETWTGYDPERSNKKIFDERNRKPVQCAR